MKRWHRFYRDFHIILVWKNTKPVPGHGFSIWSPLDPCPGKSEYGRVMVHNSSQPFGSRESALLAAQGIVDKMISLSPTEWQPHIDTDSG
ncbi:hypothetical protein [Microcoleus sp. B4-C1]|uniref:hypothetical protein n=1 Tax=Microcoleus sp. B4-C1 TaxID=2818660 RepID=UPI002FD2FBEB